MIDIETEQMLSIKAAREWLRGRTGHAPHRNTIRDWARVGLKGVVLETVRIGGTVYTSVEAMQRFSDRRRAPDAVTPSRRRTREIEAANRRATEAFG